MRLAVAVLLFALAFSGCGPSRRPATFRRPPPGYTQPVTTRINLGAQCDVVVHYDDSMTAYEVSQAAFAIDHHVQETQHLAFPVSIYLGQLWPARGTYHVWVHRDRTVGDPFSPTVLGVVRPDGAHLVLGEGQLVSDFIHQVVHMLYAPAEQHDYPPGFWAVVLDVQTRSVADLKLRRGIP